MDIYLSGLVSIHTPPHQRGAHRRTKSTLRGSGCQSSFKPRSTSSRTSLLFSLCERLSQLNLVRKFLGRLGIIVAQKVEGWLVEQGAFEQALLDLIDRVPEEKQMAISHTVQLLVGRHLEPDWEDRQRPYSIERHRAVHRLTATIRSSLAAAIAAERDRRG